MHQDHHEGRGADQSHADDVQTHRQPPHGTAEQVERSLVLVQQKLVSETTADSVQASDLDFTVVGSQ